MAETRRWDVCAFERRVRVFTWERRMASLGTFLADKAGEGREKSARSAGQRKGRMCILVMLSDRNEVFSFFADGTAKSCYNM